MNISDLPLVMTSKEVAAFFRVSTMTIYRHPKNYGGKKIRGRGFWKFPRDAVLRIAGFDCPPDMGQVKK